MVTRRTLLLGTAGFVLSACSGLPDGVPDVSAGELLSGSFHSRYRHTDVGWSIAYPPGPLGRRLPVVVFLHGRSQRTVRQPAPGRVPRRRGRSRRAALRDRSS